MGRIPCCEKDNVKRGQWTPEEDNKLSSYIAQHGTRNWRLIPKNAGLQRCGKSCRLRWTNYLRPDLKHGQFSDSEEQTIVKLHAVVGNRWSLIAAQLPGRTDNDVKNHWNTKLKKKLSGMGIDPVTHKPFSHLMAEIATTLAPPQVANLAEAALGCFKDEMLHLLTKKRIDFNAPSQNPNNKNNNNIYDDHHQHIHIHNKNESTIEKIKLGLSRAIQKSSSSPETARNWDSAGCSAFPGGGGWPTSFAGEGGGSPWNQSSMCTGSTCNASGGHDQRIMHHDNKMELEDDDDQVEENDHDHDHRDREGRKDIGNNLSSIFNNDCVLWDLPSDELMNHSPRV